MKSPDTQQRGGVSMKKNNNGNRVHVIIKNIQGFIDNMGDDLFAIETELPPGSRDPAILRFHARIKRIQSLLDTISTKIDKIDCEFTNGAIIMPVPPQHHEASQAHNLQISFENQGTAFVSINGLVPFQVSPVLAHLLQILAIDTGNTRALYANDSLVPFKSNDEIISGMMELTGGRKYTKGAARTGIYRLRKIMAREGFHGLIHTNRQLRGYRFALRRKNYSPWGAQHSDNTPNQAVPTPALSAHKGETQGTSFKT
jgi:hypothetical protein